MARTSKRRKASRNTSAAIHETKVPSRSGESPKTTNPNAEFEPEVKEWDTDDTCWGFVGGVRRPKKTRKHATKSSPSNAHAALSMAGAAVPDSFTNRHTLAREIPCFLATCRSDSPDRPTSKPLQP
jgi:hypothetical protein